MDGFRHEALFYEGQEDLFAHLVPFVHGAAEADEAVLVALPEPGLGALRAELGPVAEGVTFADMTMLGKNPGRILSVWDQFARGPLGTSGRARGVGEPIWAGRSPDEILECEIHEGLLDLAFVDVALHLLCPYDVNALSPAVVAQAAVTHSEHPPRADGLTAPLRPAPEGAHVTTFRDLDLRAVRAALVELSAHVGLTPTRTADLVLAVDEVATNSLRYGGGSGTLRLWLDGDAVVCEISDAGQIVDPLVGRRRPGVEETGGRGLWLVHQLCDLVQIRSDGDGSLVRMRMDGSRVP